MARRKTAINVSPFRRSTKEYILIALAATLVIAASWMQLVIRREALSEESEKETTQGTAKSIGQILEAERLSERSAINKLDKLEQNSDTESAEMADKISETYDETEY